MVTAAGEIRCLEEIGHATWPALEEDIRDGWLLRAAAGVTRRSNSASPVARSSVDIDDQIAMCRQWYAARELPTICRLTEAAVPRLDERLAGLGYSRQAGAVVMTRSLGALVRPDIPGTQIADAPSEQWLALMARQPGRGGEKRAVLKEMLDNLAVPAGFASVNVDGGLAAIGLGVVAADHVALYMMQTVPERRREGFGTAIAAALAAWGSNRGAHYLFLQVHPVNTAARSFYQRLGFEPRYEYWYRQRSAVCG
jgi:GNAT superfamily N-acetyltransferase